MFGLKESEVSELVRAVSVDGPALDRDAIEERFARSAWSGIAEPGDRIAGILTAAAGPATALAALVERRPAAEVLALLGSEDGLAEKDLRAALDRWMPRLASATAFTALRQAGRFGVRLSVPGDELWTEGVDDLNTTRRSRCGCVATSTDSQS